MDPLSITASIIAVLQATKEVIGYLKETKDAPKELAKVYDEARNVVILLHELKDSLAEQDPHDSWLRATSGLTVHDGPLDQYKKALEVLVSKTTSHGVRKIGQVLAWKFIKEEVIALLWQIERIKSLIQIALEIDHTKLSHAIKDDLQIVKTGVIDLQLDTTMIVDATSKIKSDMTVLLDATAVQLKTDLLQWICPVDYRLQHKDFIGRHESGTGQWFLQDTKFQEWNRSKDGTLFCPGIPGAGKTIVASLVIDYLLRSHHVADESVTFVYCNYKRQSEQSAKHMLSSILRQIIDIQPAVPKAVQDFYMSHTKKKSIPSPGEVMQVLKAASKDLRGLTIIVDALDECEARARQEFLSAVETLRQQCKVRLLATSRPFPLVQSHRTFLNQPALEVRASNEDLEKYIRSRASELHCRVMSNPDLLEDLVASMISASGGMFLLAQLLMDSFRDKLTVRDVKTALRNLPQGSDAYDVAYHAAMDRIFAQGQVSSHMAKKILAWILCAHRPLSTLELLHAVAIELGDTEIDEDNILEAGQLLTICAGLVTIDEQSDSVRFIHYTTQEYLQRNQQTWLPHANTEIARSCTAYLLLEKFQNDTFPVFSERLWSFDMRERYPFYDYAVRHWATHARDAGQESKAMVDMLLQSGKNAPSRAILTEAERGNKQNVDWLLKKTGETPSILLLMNEKHMTFFQLACHNVWTTVVEKLLRGGTPGWKLDVNNMTPLHYSVMKCCEETARLLLDVAKLPIDTSVRRAVWRYDQGNGSPRWEPHLDDNLPDELDQSSGLTALHFAVLIGSVSMTRFLIAHGANVNHPSVYKEGILHVALKQCVQGHRTSLGNYDAWDEPHHRIESTLDFIDFEPEFEDEYQQTVRALEDYRLEILDALLETNALDIHAKDIHDRTSLHCIKYHTSSGSGIETPPVSVRSLQKLIAKGAIPSRDDQGRLPLHLACQAGDTAAVRVLLQANADLEATDHNGRNALHFAAKGRYLDTIGTILETARQQGCSERLVFTRDIFGQNALHHALRNGWVEKDVVVYLADAGIITDQRDMCGKSPLAMYLEKSSMNGANMAAMMEILFSAGADPAYLSKEGLGYHHLYAQTALVLGIEPFRVLQRYGIDITTTDSDGRSLVHYYAMNGHCKVESLDFLTGLGIPLQISDAARITPLQYANIAVLRVRHVNEWESDRWGPSRATLYGYIASLLLQQ